jgi:hypothetical protein
MAVDPNLFAARRLGFGLVAGEDLPAPPRDWAIGQIRSVPKLDFYAADGTSIASTLPAEAMVSSDYTLTCLNMGLEDEAERTAMKQGKHRAPSPPTQSSVTSACKRSIALNPAAALRTLDRPGPEADRRANIRRRVDEKGAPMIEAPSAVLQYAVSCRRLGRDRHVWAPKRF